MADYEGHPLRDVMPLGQAFGAGLRRIREEHGLTLDKVASAATTFGLKWTTARVVEFEKGKIPITLNLLLSLGTALNALTDADISLSDMLGWDRYIEMPGERGIQLHASSFKSAFTGGAVDFRKADDWEIESRLDEAIVPSEVLPGVPEGITAKRLRHQHEYSGLAEERAAKRLGMSLDEFLAFELPVLGQSLMDFEFGHLGADASPQEYGHLTRRVTAMISEFAARYRAGDPDAIQQWKDALAPGPQWRPLASYDPQIAALSRRQRRYWTKKRLEYGHFDAWGLAAVDLERLADENWFTVPERMPRNPNTPESVYGPDPFEALMEKWTPAIWEEDYERPTGGTH